VHLFQRWFCRWGYLMPQRSWRDCSTAVFSGTKETGSVLRSHFPSGGFLRFNVMQNRYGSLHPQCMSPTIRMVGDSNPRWRLHTNEVAVTFLYYPGAKAIQRAGQLLSIVYGCDTKPMTVEIHAKESLCMSRAIERKNRLIRAQLQKFSTHQH